MDLNIDKEVLRSYLLGTLEAEPRAELEERILCDPPVYEELLLLEEELIDQYVADGLSKAERQQFETHFLITDERQKKLRFGQLLKRYLSSQAVPALSEEHSCSATQSNGSFQKVLSPARVCGSSRGRTRDRPALLVGTQKTSGTTGGPTGLVSAGGGSACAGLGGVTGHYYPHSVIIPPQGFNVKLELALANSSFKNYKSELFRENKPLQTDALRMETKGEQQIVPLTITGQTLSPGDYQVKLSGVSDSGQDEFIDNYSFRVTK